MKIFDCFIARSVCLIVIGFTGIGSIVYGQNAEMRERESNIKSNKEAPAECLAAFREFFAYLKKDANDIVTDEQSQTRWLSKPLRDAFAGYIKRAGKPSENPDYPSNALFLSVWNNPTTFSIVGSRSYDFRNKLNPKDNRAIIDVLYEWDEKGGSNNEYPGERSLYSYIFIFEDGLWKLDDIYTFDDEFSGVGNLRAVISNDR